MHPPAAATSASGPGSHPTHERISRRAQEFWKKYDCPADRDGEIWLEAEGPTAG